LQKIKAQLDAGDNVVFCSNHQSESDTHCYFTLMEDQMGPEFGEIARNTVLELLTTGHNIAAVIAGLRVQGLGYRWPQHCCCHRGV
jgi:hypothetical protein